VGSKKYLLTMAVLIVGMGTAHADAYSYTQTISGNWAGNNYITTFSPKTFNNHQSSLTGVTLSFV
jgi:hypothetical protein